MDDREQMKQVVMSYALQILNISQSQLPPQIQTAMCVQLSEQLTDYLTEQQRGEK
jgi:hypothetical protein